MADAAARLDEAGGGEIVVGDEDARPKGEDACRAVRLSGDAAGDGELRLADPHAVARAQAQARQQRLVDQGAPGAHQRRERAIGVGREPAVEGVAHRHRLELDERARLSRARHGRQLQHLHALDPLAREGGERALRLAGQGPRRADLHIGAHERAGRAAHRALERIGEAPHGDQRAHAECHAGQRIAPVPPGPARLARGHPDHAMAPFTGSSPTMRPSRSSTSRSAWAASAAS